MCVTLHTVAVIRTITKWTLDYFLYLDYGIQEIKDRFCYDLDECTMQLASPAFLVVVRP